MPSKKNKGKQTNAANPPTKKVTKQTTTKSPHYRPKVPLDMKTRLFIEAGGKCANPGCPVGSNVELHHIREWHVYETHNEKHMIAICPTCHSYAHYGNSVIDEDTIRKWKAIQRPPTSKSGHIYVEPGKEPKVRFGPFNVINRPQRPDGAVVFQLSPANQVSFRIIEDDILHLNLRVTDMEGHELVRVVEGHLRHRAEEPVRYEARQGRHRITAPAVPKYMHQWVLDMYSTHTHLHPLVENGRFTVLDVEVIGRGLVRVLGVWAEQERAIIVALDKIAIRLPGYNGFVFLGTYSTGGDGYATIEFAGPLEFSIFNAMLSQFSGPMTGRLKSYASPK